MSTSAVHAGAVVGAGERRLDPARLAGALATGGLRLLESLDRVGGRVEARVVAHRASIPRSRRLSATTGAVLGGGAVIAGLAIWGAAGAAGGANEWMTAPGAGNAGAASVAALPASAQAASSGPSAASEAPAAVAAKGSHGASGLTVHESLVLLDGGMYDHPGYPEIVGGSSIDLPANATVDLTIYSFDTGTAPLVKSLEIYDKALGTVGGTETVNGKAVKSLPNSAVAHTFTVPGIGLNLPIPAATGGAKGKPVDPAVVTATFHTNKTGTFTWQCYAPCGSGNDGMGGPMVDPGYMIGKVHVS